MKEKVTSILNFLIIILTIILTFVGSMKITYNELSLYYYSIYLGVSGGICLLLYITSIIINKQKLDLYDYLVFGLIILLFLSLINARNLEVAFLGFTNRNEGLLVIFSYYLFFLTARNVSNDKFIKIIICLIIVIGLCNVIYGYLQIYEPYFKLFKIKNSWMYAKGLLGNSNFFGSMMALCYPVVFGLYLEVKNNWLKFGLFILLFIFSFGVIISGCLSCFLSILVIYLLLFGYYIFIFIKKRRTMVLSRLILSIFAIITLFFSYKFFIIRNFSLEYELKKFFSESKQISEGNINQEFGTGRIQIWKKTLEGIKDNYLTGVGPDNFYYAFKEPIIILPEGFRVDKAHNDYLQKMLCEGVLSGLLFIAFLLIIFFKSFKRFDNPWYLALFLGFTAYSIQAFFNISVIRVAPLYFIVMGLLTNKTFNCDKVK